MWQPNVSPEQLAGKGDAPDRPGVKLWSSNWIALTTLILSVPGGYPLALVNWWRMGLRRKFWIQLPIAVVLTIYLVGLQPLLPELVRYTSDILIFLLAAFYLRFQMKNDITALQAQGVTVMPEKWFLGIALSVGTVLFAFAVRNAIKALLISFA